MLVLFKAMELSVMKGHLECSQLVAAQCNRQQEDHVEDHVRVARAGLRDDAHTGKEQLLGTRLLSGTLAEIQKYDGQQGLEPSRFRGWSRNDLIHTSVSPTLNDAQENHLGLLACSLLE